MKAPLAAKRVLEVLHRVGDIGPVARHAGFRQGLVEHLARRPDEGMARQVLLVARLFADEH